MFGKKKAPANMEELKKMVASLNLPCTCPDCNPGAYNPQQVCHTHQEIRLDKDPKSNVSVPVLVPRSYEPMYLVDRTIEYINRESTQPYQLQKDARQRLRVLFLETDMMANLYAKNIKNFVSLKDLQHIFGIFNDLYFFGAMKNVRIEYKNRVWAAIGPEYTGFADTPSSGRQRSIVKIDPIQHHRLYPRKCGHEVLNTLLHEALHCFLDQFKSPRCKDKQCGFCSKRVENIGPEGHGRAWQIIAAKLEKAILGNWTLGWRLDMGRSTGFLHDLDHKGGQMPSLHDMTAWGFD
ncbi:hypothetical protein BU16DRAFT_60725 [Lophium mytilinum]|uniref:SprT-like domain-containing protein n=1 Tax=Lophium mytilinum TaxID=390894 RepID=A0A6A6QP97_9PEZI|nr:hypothetical protein BU16DRAFT_60725 [Lophium mytilinum]